jgi:hypothetical protein
MVVKRFAHRRNVCQIVLDGSGMNQNDLFFVLSRRKLL